MVRIYTNWENDNFTWGNDIRHWNSVYDFIDVIGEHEECITWENDNFTWNTEIRFWDEVCEIIKDLTGGGVKNPEEYGEMPYQKDINLALKEQLQQNLDRLNREKQQKLIEVLMVIYGKNYEIKRTVKNKKDIKITIDEVKLIANDYLNIEIEYLK